MLSIVAVALLTAIAWAMGFRTRPVLDEAGARDEAEARLAGFRAGEVALARDGRGAVLRGLDGSVALLIPFGDSWLSRKALHGELSHQDGFLVAKLDEPMLGEVRLPLEPVPGWLQDISA